MALCSVADQVDYCDYLVDYTSLKYSDIVFFFSLQLTDRLCYSSILAVTKTHYAMIFLTI